MPELMIKILKILKSVYPNERLHLKSSKKEKRKGLVSKLIQFLR